MFVPKAYRLLAFGLAGVSVLGLFSSCATTGVPTGGPQDTRGPVVVAVDPPLETRNYRGKRIVFTFDEFIKGDGLQQQVFISPVPATLPEIYVANKRLIIELDPAQLDTSATYVVTLSTELSDLNEGNPLAAPVLYAFSPGSRIDTLQLAGRVVSPLTGEGVARMMVGLFNPDSVAAHKGFSRLKPQFAAVTDSAGQFQFAYLKPGTYKLLAFTDTDRSFSYSQPSESVAFAENQDVSLQPGVVPTEPVLYAFRPDTIGPRVKEVEVLNPRNLVIRFSEAVRRGSAILYGDTSRWTSDTSGFHYKGKRDEVLVHSGEVLGDSIALRVQGMADSLGNAGKDTLLTFKIRSARLKKAWVVSDPVQNPYNPFEFVVTAESPFSRQMVLDSVFRDTSGKPLVGLKMRVDGYRLHLYVPQELPIKTQASLWIDTLLVSADSFRVAKRIFKPILQPRPIDYGTLSGRVVTQRPDPLLLEFVHEDRKTRYLRRGNAFSIAPMLPGTYTIRVVVDTDGNGEWTTGWLNPRRMPEAVYVYPEAVKIRAGWDQEGFELNYPPTPADLNKGKTPSAQGPSTRPAGETRENPGRRNNGQGGSSGGQRGGAGKKGKEQP